MCADRLNSNDADGESVHIQMVTALVLQLIHCVVHLPSDQDAMEDSRVRHPAVTSSVALQENISEVTKVV